MSNEAPGDRAREGLAGGSPGPTSYRYAVNVTPKPGILDPQGRAIEQSLPHLDVRGVRDVRAGRRVELTVEATDEEAARAIVTRLAAELLSNPLIEAYALELLGATSSASAVDDASSTAGPESSAEGMSPARPGPAR